MSSIHPTAAIGSQAVLGNDVSIGPFCIIEDGAVIGDECVLAGHVTVRSQTIVGPRNQICENTVLGGLPQHLRAGARVGRVRIGAGNIIREHVTIHRGFQESGETVVGDGNMIMVNAHIAHDCTVGNQAIIANNVMMAGHVSVGDRAYLSGAVGIHQFCRIGSLAMVGGQAHIKQDVPPFVTVDGHSSTIVGLNVIGLRRNGYTSDQIQQLKRAYRIIYRSGYRWSEVLDALRAEFADGPAAEYLPFLSEGKRGFVPERRLPRAATIKLSPADADLEETEGVRMVG